MKAVAAALSEGRRDFAALADEAGKRLAKRGWTVDYVEIRRAGTLEEAAASDTHLVVLAAARLGNTRLIDNIEVGRPI